MLKGLFGQMTPLGVMPRVSSVAAFSPADLSGLTLWLKGDAITGASDGDALGSWTDSSGSGHPTTQSTGSKKPIYKTSILNGLPVVRFDGLTQTMSASFTLAQPVTVVVAANYRSARNTNDTLIDGFTVNTMRLFRITTGIKMYAGAFGPEVTLDPQAWHIYSAVFNGTNSSLEADSSTTFTGNAGTASPGGIWLASAADVEPGPVDIAELVLYNRALSSTEKSNVISYLQSKYGL